MDVPLHPEIERVVRQKVDSGEYSSIAELVEEALFLLATPFLNDREIRCA